MTRAAGEQTLRPDWWSKSLAGTVAGLALAFALSAIVVQLVPGGPGAKDIAQFAMWIVPPIWLTVFAFVYLFRDGMRAWLWLGAANVVAYLLLCVLRAGG